MSNLLISQPTMIPVARPYLGEDEEREVLAVLRSGWVTQGPRVAEFETRFAEYIGCDHAVAVSSCTTALHMALVAYGIGVGDEVICPSFSFIATANSIVMAGATPVLADIDLATYNMDPAHAEALISPHTKALLVVHQIGLPADMSAFQRIATRYGLKLIEDAACAIGSEYAGELVGSPVGDLACFSFHPRKVMTTGEGGMITTRDTLMAERLRRLRQHAMSLSDVVRHSSMTIVKETYDEVGFNFRMTDLQAGVGLAQLRRLPELLHRRRQLAYRYDEAFKDISWLITPQVPLNCRPNFQSYMVRVVPELTETRDDIMQQLLKCNISTRRGIMAIHRELPYLSSSSDALLPKTALATDTGIILPLFHQMLESDQDYIIEALRDIRPDTRLFVAD